MVDEVLRTLAREVGERCRLRGDFVLRSGQHVGEYFDKYLFESDPGMLRRVVERMIALIPPETQMLCGLELGGIPLTTMLSRQFAAAVGSRATGVLLRDCRGTTLFLIRCEGPRPLAATRLCVQARWPRSWPGTLPLGSRDR
jgi:hypothetical protein